MRLNSIVFYFCLHYLKVPGTCPAPGKCQNLMGSFVCSCPPGFELLPDGNTCAGEYSCSFNFRLLSRLLKVSFSQIFQMLTSALLTRICAMREIASTRKVVSGASAHEVTYWVRMERNVSTSARNFASTLSAVEAVQIRGPLLWPKPNVAVPWEALGATVAKNAHLKEVVSSNYY